MTSSTRFLLAFLLMAGLAFPLWDQQIVVTAVDSNHNPVSDALVQIAYQKLNAISFDKDGLIVGRTGANGLFYANLSNKVPFAYESRELKVSISTYYFDGMEQVAMANSSDLKQIGFVLPITLTNVSITVYDAENWTLEGAVVTLTGSDLQKTTSTDGKADFSFPSSTPFSGFVFYNNTLAGQFSSSNALAGNGTQAISVHIPYLSPRHDINASKHGKLIFKFLFTEVNGSAMPGQAVSFSYLGKVSNATTDQSGMASFTADRNGSIGISMAKYGYTYAYSLNATVQSGANASIGQSGGNIIFTENGTNVQANVTVALYPLLLINSLEPSKLGENCFSVYANVSDPRTSLPMQVQMSQAAIDPPSAFSNVQTLLDDSGLYYSSLCINSSMRLKVVASNRFERAESAIRLNYTAPPPPMPPTRPADHTMEMVAGALVALVVVALLLFYVYGRKNPRVAVFMGQLHRASEAAGKQLQDSVLRPVSEYLRVVRKTLPGKKGL